MVGIVANTVLYIMAKANAALSKKDVELCDVASVYCEDETIRAKANALKIHHFREGQSPREVISILKIIEQLTKLVEVIKVIFVALICFFGSAFTIMAFHNDIGISDVLARIYEMVTGTSSDGYTALEISYSIGLAIGIIVFYNHVGGKRLTSDPTPLEVEMRNYERDVNQAIVEMADRQNLEKNVES